MTQNPSSNFKMAFLGLLVCLFATPVPLGAQSASSSDQQIHWAQLGDAQLKLDSKPPLGWAVYQPDKKTRKKGTDLLLVLVGHRYMMLDVKAKLAYQVMPADIHAQGSDFESNDLAKKENLIPTSAWSIRDVGPAELIRFTLGDYGRVLDVSISHPPDLTSFY
jgi:hypothetical protein